MEWKKLFIFQIAIFVNEIESGQFRNSKQNTWRPVSHWRSTVANRNSQSNRRSYDGAFGSTTIPQKSSNEYRIEWYTKICRKSGKFCDQLRKAKSHAMQSYKRKINRTKKENKIKQNLVQHIRMKNPHLESSLANNIRDYVIQRMKQDSKKNTHYNV